MLARRMSTEMQKHILNDYKAAAKRAIFLDYDGTLVGFQVNIDQASPDDELYQLLKELSDDPANQVVMISGRNHDTLEEWLGHMKLDLIAEHGAWHKKHGEEWQKLPGLIDQWKQDILPILETYTDRTAGSFIEEKSFSLVWHYRKVESGLGELRANELMNTLRYFTSDIGLQLLPGDKVIEIKNVEINKGKATLTWLQGRTFDFKLAIGDDNTDEDIFKALPADAVTIKVGSQVSAARYYLRNFKEVRAFLKSLHNK